MTKPSKKLNLVSVIKIKITVERITKVAYSSHSNATVFFLHTNFRQQFWGVPERKRKSQL